MEDEAEGLAAAAAPRLHPGAARLIWFVSIIVVSLPLGLRETRK